MPSPVDHVELNRPLFVDEPPKDPDVEDDTKTGSLPTPGLDEPLPTPTESN